MFKEELKNKKIVRHCATTRFNHWTVTVSIFLLIFTGFGQMPIYKRYFLDQLPGLAWSSDYSITLIIHYVAAMALIFAAFYHVAYFGIRREFNLLPRRGDMKESYEIIKAIITKSEVPPCHKYLAEQRVAFVFIASTIALLIFTGLIKVLKNLPSVTFSDGFLFWTTMLHNVGTILIIIGIATHLGAFIFKENRALLPSMFTGKVDLEYVKERHCLWYDELCQQTELNLSLVAPVDGRESELNQSA